MFNQHVEYQQHLEQERQQWQQQRQMMEQQQAEMQARLQMMNVQLQQQPRNAMPAGPGGPGVPPFPPPYPPAPPGGPDGPPLHGGGPQAHREEVPSLGEKTSVAMPSIRDYLVYKKKVELFCRDQGRATGLTGIFLDWLGTFAIFQDVNFKKTTRPPKVPFSRPKLNLSRINLFSYSSSSSSRSISSTGSWNPSLVRERISL